MLVRETTPEEAAAAAPKADACDRCGAGGPEADLRLIVFRGRIRYAERTVCDRCAETIFQEFFSSSV